MSRRHAHALVKGMRLSAMRNAGKSGSLSVAIERPTVGGNLSAILTHDVIQRSGANETRA